MYEHSPELYSRIISKIQYQQQITKVKHQIVLSSFFVSGSLFVLAVISRTFYAQGSESGFFTFMNLAFSDVRVISNNFNDLMITLLESLPAALFTAALAITVAVIMALKYFIQAIASLRVLKRQMHV